MGWESRKGLSRWLNSDPCAISGNGWAREPLPRGFLLMSGALVSLGMSLPHTDCHLPRPPVWLGLPWAWLSEYSNCSHDGWSQETRVGAAIPPKGKAQDGQTLLVRTVTGKPRFKNRGSRNYLWENWLSRSSSILFRLYAWFCWALGIQRLTLQRLIQKNSLPAYILIWG